MKKLVIALSCLCILLSACGKKQETEERKTETMVAPAEQVMPEKEELPQSGSAFINDLHGNSENFLKAFQKFDEVHQYYFCSAFAMGAMSVSKPITASAMVNYFMGLGVAKYKQGINDSTYEAFNAGKNVFLYEDIVNTILEEKICENIMNDAAEYAKDNKFNTADLDKRGKLEVEKIVEYITKGQK